MINPGQRHGLRRNLRLPAAWLVTMRIAPQLHHLLGREVKGHAAILGHDGAPTCQALHRMPGQLQPVKQNLARLRHALAHQHGHQRGLAGAVGAEDGGKAPGLNPHIHRRQARPLGYAYAQIAAFEAGQPVVRTHTLLLNWRSMARKSGTPINAVSTPSGSSAGLTMVRATASALTTSAAPSRADPGSTTR